MKCNFPLKQIYEYIWSSTPNIAKGGQDCLLCLSTWTFIPEGCEFWNEEKDQFSTKFALGSTKQNCTIRQSVRIYSSNLISKCLNLTVRHALRFLIIPVLLVSGSRIQNTSITERQRTQTKGWEKNIFSVNISTYLSSFKTSTWFESKDE